MAGNHGDEYEGQVALSKLIRSLEPAEVSGRIIILPSANFPAAMAGMRTSPLDAGNLNRACLDSRYCRRPKTCTRWRAPMLRKMPASTQSWCEAPTFVGRRDLPP
jgi:predicted deacylase